MCVCGYVSLCGTCYSWAGIKASYRKLYGLCGIIINTYVNVFWLCLVNNNDMTAHLWLSGSDGNHENDSIRWTWSPCMPVLPAGTPFARYLRRACFHPCVYIVDVASSMVRVRLSLTHNNDNRVKWGFAPINHYVVHYSCTSSISSSSRGYPTRKRRHSMVTK